MLYVEGGNHRIELSDGVAVCHVWRREDVDSETGARFAEELGVHVEALARGQAAGMVFDVSQAPVVSGPKTQTMIGRMLAEFERHRKPVGVVVGTAAMQRLQMQRLVNAHAPVQGAVFETVADARTWVSETLAARSK